MTSAEAVAFLRAAMPPEASGTWADLGAGRGTFTEALARILGPAGTVVAVDSDPESVRALESLRDTGAPDLAAVVAVHADFRELDAIAELDGRTLDGVLFANALHFVADAELVLRRTAARLRPDGRLVVIEYERTSPNPWVPHPLPPAKLRDVTVAAGFTVAEVVARRPSRYHRKMYCAVATRSSERSGRYEILF